MGITFVSSRYIYDLIGKGGIRYDRCKVPLTRGLTFNDKMLIHLEATQFKEALEYGGEDMLIAYLTQTIVHEYMHKLFMDILPQGIYAKEETICKIMAGQINRFKD